MACQIARDRLVVELRVASCRAQPSQRARAPRPRATRLVLVLRMRLPAADVAQCRVRAHFGKVSDCRRTSQRAVLLDARAAGGVQSAVCRCRSVVAASVVQVRTMPSGFLIATGLTCHSVESLSPSTKTFADKGRGCAWQCCCHVHMRRGLRRYHSPEFSAMARLAQRSRCVLRLCPCRCQRPEIVE